MLEHIQLKLQECKEKGTNLQEGELRSEHAEGDLQVSMVDK
jgi:hypothetical protein